MEPGLENVKEEPYYVFQAIELSPFPILVFWFSFCVQTHSLLSLGLSALEPTSSLDSLNWGTSLNDLYALTSVDSLC